MFCATLIVGLYIPRSIQHLQIQHCSSEKRDSILFCGSVPKHSSFYNPPPAIFFFCQGSDLSSLGRFIMKKPGLSDDGEVHSTFTLSIVARRKDTRYCVHLHSVLRYCTDTQTHTGSKLGLPMCSVPGTRYGPKKSLFCVAATPTLSWLCVKPSQRRNRLGGPSSFAAMLASVKNSMLRAADYSDRMARHSNLQNQVRRAHSCPRSLPRESTQTSHCAHCSLAAHCSLERRAPPPSAGVPSVP